MYTLAEVAEKLDIKVSTLTDYVYKKHRIRKYFRKVGGKMFMTEDDFYNYIEDQPHIDEVEEE